MTETTTKERNILVIAVAVGLGVGILAALLFSFSLAGAGILALIIGIAVAVALWMRSTEATPVQDASDDRSVTAQPQPAPAASKPATPEPAAQPTAAPRSAEAAGRPASADDDPLVKSSARLAGQDDLASRKGSWTYSKDGVSQVEAVPNADTSPQAHPGAAGTSEVEARPESADEAEKPQMLSAPRDGGADDLMQIKGIGPKLAATLHDMGVYHIDQIAGWQASEVAWMDDNLTGFKGRVSRDDWVGQAKALAADPRA